MRINISTSITAIDPAAWDALDAGGSPFLRHAFLAALENTGCVGAGTGWHPAPITLHDERGLAAAAPAYVKAHSFGEFVFDFSWAQAYAQHGLAYYPKLVLGVPFTPATGAAPAGPARPRCRDDARDTHRRHPRIRRAARISPRCTGCSSRDDDRDALRERRLARAPRRAVPLAQPGLPRLRPLPRKFHRREAQEGQARTPARGRGRRRLRHVVRRGTRSQRVIDEVYDLHRDTFLRHGHEPYLTREFFRRLPAALGDTSWSNARAAATRPSRPRCSS